MSMPTPEIRSLLWKNLLPNAAPLSDNIDFLALGRKFELFPLSIQSAISSACAEVATRSENPMRKLFQAHFSPTGGGLFFIL